MRAHEKRDVPITNAAFGMIGLELAVPTMLALVRAGHLTLAAGNRSVLDASRRGSGTCRAAGSNTGDAATLTMIDPERRLDGHRGCLEDEIEKHTAARHGDDRPGGPDAN